MTKTKERVIEGLVRIRVRNERGAMVSWQVPRGFGKDYKWRARNGGPKPQVLRDILELVGYTATLEALGKWTLFRRVQVEAYAARIHLNAGDAGLQHHVRPSWMPEPWKGPMQGEGIFGSNPTVLE